MIIWLASYPRSGNTFLRVILNNIFGIKTYSIYNDKADIGKDQQTSDVVGHEFLPDGFDIDQARDADELYLIKTHDYPPNVKDKAIYLIRDGRETSLSYMKFEQAYTDPEKTLTDVIYGDILFGSWGQHVKAWNPKKRNNTLLIKFETLIDNPEKYLKPISEFINIEPRGKEIPTFDELKNINPRFFRNGKKDLWKTEFSEDEQLAFWMNHYTQMLEYGYNQDIPELMNSGDHVALFRQLSNEIMLLRNYLTKQRGDLRYGELQQLKQMIKEKDLQLKSNQQFIGKRYREVQELKKVIDTKDHELESKQQFIGKRYREVQELKKVIDTKDHELDSKQQFIGKRYREVQELKKVIDTKDHELESKQRFIEKRYRKLQQQKQKIEQLEMNITGKDNKLTRLESQLMEQRQVIDEYRKLELSIDNMRRYGTVIKNPIKKFSAYKKVLTAHNQCKKLKN